MSVNYFVIWKGERIGPFTKEGLEREFIEGKMGLVRTVQAGEKMILGRDFVADIEIKRREDELERQLQMQAQQIQAARKQAEETLQQAARQREEHLQELESASKRSSAKTTPPPIPEVNPWAPKQKSSIPHPEIRPPWQDKPSQVAGWWGGNGPVVTASVFCLLCLLSGQVLRELAGVIAIVTGVILILRKRSVGGAILIASAILAYGVGFLLSDLIHDYISKNYPN